MSEEIVFDKAKWHYEADDFPADLDEHQAFVHTGLFVGWVIDAGLYSEEFAEDFEKEIRRFKARKMTGPGLYRAADGVFADDMLNEEGLAFTQAYFDFEKGKYLKDYNKLLEAGLASEYRVPDTWESYDTLKPQIDKRYAAWQKKSRSTQLADEDAQTGLSATQRRTLSRKAMDNSLEVEHLIKVAMIGHAADAPFLRALKKEHGWSDTGREGRKRVVPFGRWSDTVCRFLEGGYEGLVQLAGESLASADYCVSVLEELKTAESVSALLAIGGLAIERPSPDVRLAALVARAFNFVLSLKGAPEIDPAVEQQVRDFLHRLLAEALSEVQRSSVVCALRGVGDTVSVNLIDSLPPFRGCWAGLEKSAVRQIKQRLRQDKGARG